MRKVVVPELKFLLNPANDGRTGKVRPNTAGSLLVADHIFYGNRNQFPIIIFKTEAQWCDLPVGVGTGDHLYRNVNTQDAFHRNPPSL